MPAIILLLGRPKTSTLPKFAVRLSAGGGPRTAVVAGGPGWPTEIGGRTAAADSAAILAALRSSELSCCVAGGKFNEFLWDNCS